MYRQNTFWGAALESSGIFNFTTLTADDISPRLIKPGQHLLDHSLESSRSQYMSDREFIHRTARLCCLSCFIYFLAIYGYRTFWGVALTFSRSKSSNFTMWVLVLVRMPGTHLKASFISLGKPSSQSPYPLRSLLISLKQALHTTFLFLPILNCTISMVVHIRLSTVQGSCPTC